MLRSFPALIAFVFLAAPVRGQVDAPAPDASQPPAPEAQPEAAPTAPDPGPAPTPPPEPMPEPEPEPKPEPKPKPVNKAQMAIVDPAEVADDADYRMQGEYFGQITGADGRFGYTGVQVIARGDGRFDAVHYEGGLPGGGWNRADKRTLSGELVDGRVELVGEAGNIVVDGERATLHAPDGRTLGSIRRILRVSPNVGATPPPGAIVLFDGSNTDHFEKGEMTEEGLLKMGTQFKDAYQDFQLHIEFRLPYMPYATGQGRANSGVYIHGRYETQILDSFGLEGVENECGSLYKQRRPDVNMAFPPLRWQTYDITFTAPKFDADGQKTANARLTLIHNGVAVHDDVEITNKTGAGQKEGPKPLPIKLQDHRNPVVFRNIWLVDRTPQSEVVRVD